VTSETKQDAHDGVRDHGRGEPPRASTARSSDAGAPGLRPLLGLAGAGLGVPCLDGTERPYRDLDCAASTPAATAVADAVAEFLPRYSSVHRGAGYKSRLASAAYESARDHVLRFTGRAGGDQVAVICRNTTEALNHLAFRLRLGPADVVLTTVVEHHANLLPWARFARRRYVECGPEGTFDVEDVVAGLDARPRPALLAVTGASNVTGWLPPLDALCAAAHERGVPVVLDAAQLAPHRPLPPGPDYVAFSGHKLYAPFGAGALIGPRETFATGEPFLAGGGAVELVDLDEVVWSPPPEREEAGSPNVIGAVALDAAMGEIERLGWEAVQAHETALGGALRRGLASLDGVRLLGPPLDAETLSVGTFVVEGLHHGLLAARLAAEWGIGVRHGCFCAHPYLLRLLDLDCKSTAAVRAQILEGDRRAVPGAVRASTGLGTTLADVETLLSAVKELAGGSPAPVPYSQDPVTGDFFPDTPDASWWSAARPAGGGCAQG
jgi:selenocysteine lyase/cysteine desulfurase